LGRGYARLLISVLEAVLRAENSAGPPHPLFLGKKEARRMNRGAETSNQPRAERSKDQNMKQNATINANHPDYWPMLKAAHRDIQEVLELELDLPSLDESVPEIVRCQDDVDWRSFVLNKHSYLQDLLDANPLLVRLRESISEDALDSWL
jgi:hypothetical protein